MLGDGVAEEGVSLLGTIAFEGAAVGEFVHACVHGFNSGGRQSFRDITDAATNQARGFFGKLLLEGGDATTDFRKEVTGFELEEIFVDECHDADGIEKDAVADKRENA